MGARLFSAISPAKFGRLWPFHFRKVATWLLEVQLIALSDTLKVIEVFPDVGGNMGTPPSLVTCIRGSRGVST